MLSSNPGSSIDSDRFEVTLRQDSVDVLGRPLNQRVQCIGVPGVAWPCGDWLPNSTSNRYNRLGALVIQERDRIAAGTARDTLRYDRSGNQIQRRSGFGSTVTEMSYPALSNRLAIRRDSVAGSPGHSDRTYWYDAAGNRIKQGKPFEVDTVVWQFDALSRLVGSASAKTGEPAFLQFNTCRWDAAWRLAQPCGNGGQLALMGLNVTRSSLGWFFVHAPGIDEALLLIDRTDNFFVNKRLQAVTDGRGQLIAITDSAGFITEAYAGSGHDQSSWQGAGLTTQAQTFDPRKWQTNDEWGGIQQFRNRAYDPATGTWIQEDPMGVAGGVNVYRFNNGNPVGFGDPLGLDECDDIKDKAKKKECRQKKAANGEETQSNACTLSSPAGDYRAGTGVDARFNPETAQMLSSALTNLNKQGIVPVITSGYRSPQSQAALRSGNSPLVITPARVSFHQIGAAVDFGTNSNAGNNGAIRGAMTGAGFIWGGNFSSPDPVHFQSQPAGTRPSAAMVAACSAATGGN